MDAFEGLNLSRTGHLLSGLLPLAHAFSVSISKNQQTISQIERTLQSLSLHQSQQQKSQCGQYHEQVKIINKNKIGIKIKNPHLKA